MNPNQSNLPAPSMPPVNNALPPVPGGAGNPQVFDNGYYSPLHPAGPAPQVQQPYPTPAGQPYAQQPYPQQPNMPNPNMQPGMVAQPGAPGVQPANPVAKSNPNSTQNSLQIAEVRDGLVIMNDGSFRSVIMVKSINFDLMSPQEQEAVEFSYQGFLNSLYFPIQIFIHSRKVDLGPYIDRLDKIRSEHDNMLLSVLMEDYINFMDQLAMQTNIMDKKFYVVIPYFPVVDAQKALSASKGFFSGLSNLFNAKEQHVVVNETDLNKAKDELKNRVQSVLSGLMQCGVQGLPLDTQELIELYYDVYNPDTATRQELKNFNNLSAPVVTKGTGTAPQPNLNRELL